jgi:hypothetical protein
VKVFRDANILFSAANPRWLTRHLLDVLEQTGAELTSSAYVWDEAERNVRSHFPMNLDELGKLKHRLGWIKDTALAEGLFESLPKKDRPVLAAAIQGNQSTKPPPPHLTQLDTTQMPQSYLNWRSRRFSKLLTRRT